MSSWGKQTSLLQSLRSFTSFLAEMELTLFKVRGELRGKRLLPEQMFWRILMKAGTLPCLNTLISLNKPCDNYLIVFYLCSFYTYNPYQMFHHWGIRHCYRRTLEASPCAERRWNLMEDRKPNLTLKKIKKSSDSAMLYLFILLND